MNTIHFIICNIFSIQGAKYSLHSENEEKNYEILHKELRKTATTANMSSLIPFFAVSLLHQCIENSISLSL